MKKKQNQVDRSSDFRAILLGERNRIVSRREGGLDVLTISESLAVDDQAPLLHEQFVALRQRGMNHRRLKLIDAALAKVDRGNFGVCEECGEGIPLLRLNIIPWAAHCVACQERLDQEKSLGGRDLLLAA